jgi:galactoside O-acetyltransferase
MGYLSLDKIIKMGITILGENIKISKYARIYNPKKLILHNNIRIDDFVIFSGNGNIEIKNYVHVGSYSSISSSKNIVLSNYSGLSSGVRLFGSTDDYSGNYMTNPTVPKDFTNVKMSDIILEEHVIIGANTVVLPGVLLKEGCAIGANSLVNKSTEKWKIYAGNPAKEIGERNKKCTELCKNIII